MLQLRVHSLDLLVGCIQLLLQLNILLRNCVDFALRGHTINLHGFETVSIGGDGIHKVGYCCGISLVALIKFLLGCVHFLLN